MAKILSLLGVPVVLIGLTWLGGIIYFQESGKDVTETGLLVWFVLLPLALVGLWLGAKLALKAARDKKAAAPTADAAPGTVATTPEEPKAAPLAILAAEFHCAGGEDAQSALEGFRGGELRPSLNPALLDSEGLPVTCALIDTLDEVSCRETVQVWMQRTESSLGFDPAQGARMLAMLEGPLERMLEHLSSMPETADKQPQRLSIKLFVPAHWQELLVSVLRERIAQFERFTIGFIRHDPQRPDLHQDPLRIAAAFAVDTRELAAPPMLLLVGCDSQCSENSVEQLAYAGRLFGAGNQQGVVPGEAAALVLLSPLQGVPANTSALAHLGATRWAAHSTSIDEIRRPSPELLGKLLGELLTPLKISPEAISVVLSDCDHRSARNTEMAAFITANLSDLDAVADHLAIGQGIGDAASANSTLALALAAHQVHDQDASVLLASMTDPQQRSLALLAPCPETNT